MKSVGKHKILQLNELNEFRLAAYESTSYTEKRSRDVSTDTSRKKSPKLVKQVLLFVFASNSFLASCGLGGRVRSQLYLCFHIAQWRWCLMIFWEGSRSIGSVWKLIVEGATPMRKQSCHLIVRAALATKSSYRYKQVLIGRYPNFFPSNLFIFNVLISIFHVYEC